MVPVSPESFRSHEAEDVDSIPDVFFDEQLLDPDVKDEDLPFLHWALAVSRTQGRCPAGQIYSQPERLLCVEGRAGTFLHGWHGPHRNKMAVAGFYRSQHDQLKAICAFCHMECKGWQSGEDPWQRHKNLSPNCRRVKCAKQMGGKHRRHSYTSLQILTS